MSVVLSRGSNLLDGGIVLSSHICFDAPLASDVWTDDPVTSETPIKAVQVNELRHAVDLRRQKAGLEPFRWTDDPIIARYTVIRAIHFLELRNSIQELWHSDGEGDLPDWTVGSPPSADGRRPILASDMNDLRRWIDALSLMRSYQAAPGSSELSMPSGRHPIGGAEHVSSLA